MTSKTQNGPGGACEMQWCEKEKQISGPAQDSVFFNLQLLCTKHAPLLSQDSWTFSTNSQHEKC